MTLARLTMIYAGPGPERRQSAAPLAQHAEGNSLRHQPGHHQRVKGEGDSLIILLQSEKPFSRKFN